YGTVVDRDSAREILAVKMNAAAEADARAEADKAAAVREAEAAKVQAEYEKAVRDMEKASRPPAPRRTTTRTARDEGNPLVDFLGSRKGQTVVRQVLRGVFSTLKRK
ncbi:MAG: helicase HerA-like domain-containing protein, partial [Rhodoglobus sp.]|nr:helicase HerA-like domain-containing protein [Rhodoglobus sp.]